MSRWDADEVPRDEYLKSRDLDWFEPDPAPPHGILRPQHRPWCPECDRSFDLLDPEQAEEWFYGHDCE